MGEEERKRNNNNIRIVVPVKAVVVAAVAKFGRLVLVVGFWGRGLGWSALSFSVE